MSKNQTQTIEKTIDVVAPDEHEQTSTSADGAIDTSAITSEQAEQLMTEIASAQERVAQVSALASSIALGTLAMQIADSEEDKLADVQERALELVADGIIDEQMAIDAAALASDIVKQALAQIADEQTSKQTSEDTSANTGGTFAPSTGGTITVVLQKTQEEIEAEEDAALLEQERIAFEARAKKVQERLFLAHTAQAYATFEAKITPLRDAHEQLTSKRARIYALTLQALDNEISQSSAALALEEAKNPRAEKSAKSTSANSATSGTGNANVQEYTSADVLFTVTLTSAQWNIAQKTLDAHKQAVFTLVKTSTSADNEQTYTVHYNVHSALARNMNFYAKKRLRDTFGDDVAKTLTFAPVPTSAPVQEQTSTSAPDEQTSEQTSEQTA